MSAVMFLVVSLMVCTALFGIMVMLMSTMPMTTMPHSDTETR